MKRLFVVILIICSLSSSHAMAKENDDVAKKQKIAAQQLKAIIQSAEQGNINAQFEAGKRIYSGRGETKNISKAIKWFKMAAMGKHVVAQYTLGAIYDQGMGVSKNQDEAFKWYKMAAEAGNIKAQYYVGKMYSEGDGTVEDDKEALIWYKKAAKRGDAMAQYNLGVMYTEGDDVDVPLDYRLAYVWFKCASSQGIKEATKTINSLEKKMSSEEKYQARTLFRTRYRKYIPKKK